MNDYVFYTFESDGMGGQRITHYNVPDANTETWIKSRPKEHAAEMARKAGECGANFRRIVKMIKWWNRSHGDYLQSYHIEVLALKVFDGNLDDIAWSIYQFFDKARVLLQSPLFYDIDIVDGYLGYADRQEVLKRFDTARAKASTAWYSGYILNLNANQKDAITSWRQIFGEKFPTYG